MFIVYIYLLVMLFIALLFQTSVERQSDRQTERALTSLDMDRQGAQLFTSRYQGITTLPVGDIVRQLQFTSFNLWF